MERGDHIGVPKRGGMVSLALFVRGIARLLPLAGAAALMLLAAVRWGGARATADSMALLEDLASPGAAAPTLLFVFQPGDCPNHAALLGSWTELHKARRVRALAIGLGFPSDSASLEELARSAGLDFPFRSDLAAQAERLLFGLGYRRTPVTVLLDRMGRVRLALASPDDPAARREAVRLVGEQADRLRREPTPAPEGRRPGSERGMPSSDRVPVARRYR